VFFNAFQIECYQYMQGHRDCHHWLLTQSNLKKIMTAPYTRFIVLDRKNLTTPSHEHLAKDGPDGLHALASGSSYHNIYISAHKVPFLS
jgi:hypothetical protein